MLSISRFIAPVALLFVAALSPAANARFASMGPTPATADNGDRLATTAWVNNFVNAGLPLPNGQISIGSAGGTPGAQTPSAARTLSLFRAAPRPTINAGDSTPPHPP